jgi:geranylgeranyl diphosphate synthase type I
MGDELDKLARDMREAVEQEMRSVLRWDDKSPDLFHGMMHYHMGWVDAELSPVTAKAGKRIRPVLTLLTCMAAGGEWRRALPAAAAIELIHNFSLIHDDIEDASPTRRGRTTLWNVWGIEQAINAGDAMFALAHLALSRLSNRGVKPRVVVEAFRSFDRTCLRLTQGQHADMAFETMDEVSVEQYLEMIAGKTAALLSLCAELGALVAGRKSATVDHYSAFGRELGLAFQVKDDILGIWGDETVTGKSAATDVATRKKTLPVLYGLTKSARLRRLYRRSDESEEFVKQVVALLDEKGARKFASDKAREYSHSALFHLDAVQPLEPARTALGELAEMLLKWDF